MVQAVGRCCGGPGRTYTPPGLPVVCGDSVQIRPTHPTAPPKWTPYWIWACAGGRVVKAAVMCGQSSSWWVSNPGRTRTGSRLFSHSSTSRTTPLAHGDTDAISEVSLPAAECFRDAQAASGPANVTACGGAFDAESRSSSVKNKHHRSAGNCTRGLGGLGGFPRPTTHGDAEGMSGDQSAALIESAPRRAFRRADSDHGGETIAATQKWRR